MIGYPYIQELFTSILKEAKVIQGRFYFCPKMASEINNANINEIVIATVPNGAKWPTALLMPPIKRGNFQFSGDEIAGPQIGYNYYNIQMLFLRPTAYTAYNQPSQPLPNTAISTHTAVETWHDMGRCAENFLQVLRQVLIYHKITAIEISESGPQAEIPVTDIGNDKLSGVLFTFTLMVNGGCDIEDYPVNYLDLIQVPELKDTHLTHINS